MTSPLLDDIDRALISALVADGRATYAALAPLVGMSQGSVRTRVQRLLDERIITVSGRIDPASLGLGVFCFAFVEAATPAAALAAQLAEIDEVVFVVLASGRFDLMVEMRCADEQRLLEILDEIRALDGVRRLQTATSMHYDKQDWTGVGRLDAVSVAHRPGQGSVSRIDEVDRRLIRALMADGRASYAALAPLVELSQAAVRDRVLELLRTGVITIQAHPVPEAMGIGGFAGLAVKASGPLDPLVDALVSRPETCVVVRTLGRFDVMAEVWYSDVGHLSRLLEDLRGQPGVGAIDTVPYHSVAYERFSFP